MERKATEPSSMAALSDARSNAPMRRDNQRPANDAGTNGHDTSIPAGTAEVSDDLVFIAGGTFRIGSDDHYPEEAPAHWSS